MRSDDRAALQLDVVPQDSTIMDSNAAIDLAEVTDDDIVPNHGVIIYDAELPNIHSRTLSRRADKGTNGERAASTLRTR